MELSLLNDAFCVPIGTDLSIRVKNLPYPVMYVHQSQFSLAMQWRRHTSYKPAHFFPSSCTAQNRPLNHEAYQLSSTRSRFSPAPRTRHSRAGSRADVDNRNELGSLHRKAMILVDRVTYTLYPENVKSNASCFWYSLIR